MLTEFGKRLRDIRLERNLLLEDMADSLRCSVVQLSAIESGTQAIPDGIIARLSVIYELSEGEIRALEEARRLPLGAKGYSLKDYLAQIRNPYLSVIAQARILPRVLTRGSIRSFSAKINTPYERGLEVRALGHRLQVQIAYAKWSGILHPYLK